jgi:hypothetical protein
MNTDKDNFNFYQQTDADKHGDDLAEFLLIRPATAGSVFIRG